MFCLLISMKQRIGFRFHTLQGRVLRWTKPSTTSLLLGTLANLARGKSELIAENALLRHQLSILRRQIKQPMYRKVDRLLLVVLARMDRAWKQALFLSVNELFRSICGTFVEEEFVRSGYEGLHTLLTKASLDPHGATSSHTSCGERWSIPASSESKAAVGSRWLPSAKVRVEQ